MSGLSERDDLTLRTMALLDRTTVAAQRREAIRAYCAQARKDPGVAEIVRLVLAARRERRGNVIPLRGAR